MRRGLRFKRLAGVFWQLGVAVDARDFLLEAAHRCIIAARRPIGRARDQRRPSAVAVGVGKRPIDGGNAVLLCFDRAVAQYQMRKVDVELMWRHIGALRHEAHVAKGAGVHDLFEIRARDRVEFAAFQFVDEIEESREGVAQIETAPARVTNIKNPSHFGVELRVVVKIGAAPIQRMPNRGLETAFSHLCCSKTQRPSWPGLSRPSTPGCCGAVAAR